MSILTGVEHRPWPMPGGAWVMAQVWHDLLFAHWPIEPDVMRARVPPALELDTYDGRAWLGIVPFRMSGVRLRGTPALPGLSSFPELNVRTYVTFGGKPGVLFFSLDAANALAVRAARAWFHLPYFRARMTCEDDGGDVRYEHVRLEAPAAELRARYGPDGDAYEAQRGTLDHWLTERYCLYASPRGGALWRSEIHHLPWKVQAAHAAIDSDSMATAHGFELHGAPPLLHFARRQDVVVWRPRRLR